jgi:integrase
MAWLETEKSGRFKVCFRYGGRKYKKALKTSDPDDANALVGRLEENLRLLERGRLELPHGANLAVFLLSDGKLSAKPKPARAFTLAELQTLYVGAQAASLERNTLDTVETHLKHLQGTLGARFAVGGLTTSDLQAHIDRRAQDVGRRGKPLSPSTIKKEIATLSSRWTWAVQRELITAPFPGKGPTYPKTREKPPFQTWEEIERQVSRGGLTEDERAELWDTLFLQLHEIDELLGFVKENARHDFIHPMFVFAAHTGARRSEVLRSRVADFDFDGRTVLVREKKRVRGKQTFRRVPLSPLLSEVMRGWFAAHPGGSYAICQGLRIERSRKTRSDYVPLTVDEANDHFHRTLAGSKWERLTGFHVLRHSFASNCAARGVDQRLINAWLGHQTEEMVRRYRHLLPSQSTAAIDSVFGQVKRTP